jgi:disulfide bond formation protein DsbB
MLRAAAASRTSLVSSSRLPSRRALNALGFAVCAALVGYALYAQHVGGLQPCPLCVFQRIALIALGLVLLAAAVHAPGARGARLYGVLAGVCALAGIAVAGRHLWLQSLPPEAVPACGPGLGYLLDTFPLAEALKQVFSGSGECAVVDWTFLGLSMPGWLLVWFIALGAAAVANGWRR